jgi:hypothetical protein
LTSLSPEDYDKNNNQGDENEDQNHNDPEADCTDGPVYSYYMENEMKFCMRLAFSGLVVWGAYSCVNHMPDAPSKPVSVLPSQKEISDETQDEIKRAHAWRDTHAGGPIGDEEKTAWVRCVYLNQGC